MGKSDGNYKSVAYGTLLQCYFKTSGDPIRRRKYSEKISTFRSKHRFRPLAGGYFVVSISVFDQYSTHYGGGSRPISRVLSSAIIHLGCTSPYNSSNLPGNNAGHIICSPIWSCSRWGLPCHCCYQQRGALLPHHFTLTGPEQGRRYLFCGTGRGLAPPRCYLAPCPMEPGLSSLLLVTTHPQAERLHSRLPPWSVYHSIRSVCS